MNSKLDKGQRALKKTFTSGTRIRHIYSPYRDEVHGIITSQYEILSNGKHFTSISTFAESHKADLAGRYIAANGWAECEYWDTVLSMWRSVCFKRNSQTKY